MPRGMSNATKSLKGGFPWAQELWQDFIPVDKIVFVTTNGQFSASMIRKDKELVIVDKLSSMAPALVKTLLEQGCVVDQPEALFDCPFYITTNCLPNSGDQNHRAYRRSHIFRTQILLVTITQNPPVDL